MAELAAERRQEALPGPLAPPGVQEWMRPAEIDTAQAAFTIVHYLFSTRKTGLGDLGAGC